MRKLFLIVMMVCCLTACSDDGTYAPVMDVVTIERVPTNGIHRVAPGESLYAIAWRYGLDYRYIARLNHLSQPYHLVVGQTLYLRGNLLRMRNKERVKRQSMQSTPISSQPTRKAPAPVFVERESNTPVSQWRWPARGPIIGVYSSLNKGINIAGHVGDPIYATAAGQIVYSGSRLRGYGNLIIIKHNSTYLSAYAHNSATLVKEGDWVKTGQKIAEMGSTGSQTVMLHFEIRRSGQPVNPLRYLGRA